MSSQVAQLKETKEVTNFNPDQVNLIKNYLCKGITDEELKLFGFVCKKTGLDPFLKQIYAVKRKDQMTIQTSIDGYRLIAERTGKYCPGREPSYTYDQNGKLISATAYVKKQTADGTWHEIGATAFVKEYKPAYTNQFWDTKEHIMTAKCAESLALRKAFPNELSSLYSEEEMQQAINVENKISSEEVGEIETMLDQCPEEFKEKVLSYIQKECKAPTLYDLKKEDYAKIKQRLSVLLNNNKKIEEANGTENS